MKNLRMVHALILGIGLLTLSCSSDDNEGETLAPLAGQWDLSKVGTTVGDTETLVDAPQNQAGCAKDYINLKLDNSLIEGDYGASCALTTQEGIYSRSHNNLTRVIDGVTTVQDIANLTLTELKLKDADGDIELYVRH